MLYIIIKKLLVFCPFIKKKVFLGELIDVDKTIFKFEFGI
jgi:hypothetical protein